MNKDSSIEAIEAKIQINWNNEIKDYFNSEIQEGKIMSKKLSKYIVIILTKP